MENNKAEEIYMLLDAAMRVVGFYSKNVYKNAKNGIIFENLNNFS